MFEAVPDSIVPPPEKADVAALEQFFGIELPADYREFLAHFHGAKPAAGTLWVEGRPHTVERFLVVLAENQAADDDLVASDVSVTADDLGEALIDADGRRLLPVAALAGGNYVCLDYRGGSGVKGVCLWDKDASAAHAPACAPVASSFAEFVSQLSPAGAQAAAPLGAPPVSPPSAQAEGAPSWSPISAPQPVQGEEKAQHRGLFGRWRSKR